MKNCKKLRLWVLSHGRVPGSRMAHKAYRWIDTAGRPTTPPPDPFDIMEQRAKGGYKVLSEADERKVCHNVLRIDCMYSKYSTRCSVCVACF